MYVVSVIPLSQNAPSGELSYWSTKKIDCGTFVKVKLRNKDVMGVVVGIEDAKLQRTALRQASFKLKKIPTILGGICPDWLLKTAGDLSSYFASSIGLVLHSLLPQILIPIFLETKLVHKKEGGSDNLPPDRLAIQGNDSERLDYYKNLVRESFARGESILVVSPIKESAMVIFISLSQKIESHSILISDKASKKEREVISKKISGSEPLLIVSTPANLAVPREDIKTIIVDSESSNAYRRLRRPFLDWRIVAEFLAKHRAAKIIYGDRLLRLETHKGILDGNIIPLTGLKRVTAENLSSTVINMAKERKDRSREPFTVFSEELVSLLEESGHSGERVFIFTVRRGLAPVTICGDCGKTVLCKQCSAPVVLHESAGSATQKVERMFVCHHCGIRRGAAERCVYCDSWRLKMLGVGSQLAFRELEKLFPARQIFLLDSDSAKTAAAAKKISASFYETAGSVLVGTEKSLPYLNKPIEHTAVGSLDSLFAIPDFRMNEKIAGLILKLKEITSKGLLIQTRNPEEFSFREILQGGFIKEFINKELNDRRTYSYPPYALFIKINTTVNPRDYEKTSANLLKLLASWKPSTYKAFTPMISGRVVLNCLLKLDLVTWPDDELANIINHLPPSFRVEINPENIL